MDSLFLAADEMLMDSYEALFQVADRDGSLQTESRAQLNCGNTFDSLMQLILCTKALLWRFPAQGNYAWRKNAFKELNFGCRKLTQRSS